MITTQGLLSVASRWCDDFEYVHVLRLELLSNMWLIGKSNTEVAITSFFMANDASSWQ